MQDLRDTRIESPITKFYRVLCAKQGGHPLLMDRMHRKATSRRGWGAPAATARLDCAGGREGVDELVELLTATGNGRKRPESEVGGADGSASRCGGAPAVLHRRAMGPSMQFVTAKLEEGTTSTGDRWTRLNRRPAVMHCGSGGKQGGDRCGSGGAGVGRAQRRGTTARARAEARARSFIGASGAWRAAHARRGAARRPGHGRPGRNRGWAQMGLAWTGSGSVAGPGGDAVGRWVGPSGSAQIDRI
jgi:hypothetical protein